MPILYVLLVIAMVGVLVWGLKYIPFIDETFKKIITVVAVIATVIWLLSLFGFWSHINAIHFGR
jgi:hypothetical protein